MNEGIELNPMSSDPTVGKPHSYQPISRFSRLTEGEERTDSKAKLALSESVRGEDEELDLDDLDAKKLDPPYEPPVDRANERAVEILVSEQKPGPLAQVQVAVKEVPAIDVAKVKEIKDLVTNNPNDLSTQQLLSEALQRIATLGYQAEVVSTLKGSPKPELETFSVPSAPGEAYYKVGVTYQIIVTKDGKDVKGFDIPVIERELYTTSKTPEGAIFTGNDFKRTVVELAKAHSDPNYKGRLGFDKAKQEEVMKQRSFKFSYTYNTDGRPETLKSIHSEDKDKTDLKAKADPDAKKFVYYRDLKTQELHRIEKSDPQATLSGRAIYATEEEALLSEHYVVKDDSLYERFETSKTVDQQLSAIKEEIKKKEDEVAAIKKSFTERFLFSARETKEFKQFLADLAAEQDFDKGRPVDEKKLSPGMQNQIKLKTELKELITILGNETTIDDELLALTKMKTIMEGPKPADYDPLNHPIEIDADTQEIMQDIAAKYPDDKILNGNAPVATEEAKLNRCIEIRKSDLNKIVGLKQQIRNHPTQKAKTTFNAGLDRLQKANQELKLSLEQLKKLQQGAKEKVLDPTVTGEPQQVAQYLEKSITDKEIANLEAAIQSNDEFMNSILLKLTPA